MTSPTSPLRLETPETILEVVLIEAWDINTSGLLPGILAVVPPAAIVEGSSGFTHLPIEPASEYLSTLAVTVSALQCATLSQEPLSAFVRGGSDEPRGQNEKMFAPVIL